MIEHNRSHTQSPTKICNDVISWIFLKQDTIYFLIFVNAMFKKQLDPEDFYYSPEGYIVFTEKYHLKRGHCCKSGCKHCPYGYDKKTGNFIKNKKQ